MLHQFTVDNSSNIAKIAHDGKDTLQVEFNTGHVYEYPGVPLEKYHEFRKADSKGSYFAANIKRQYNGRKVA